MSVQGTETNNCYPIKNGHIVRDESGCSASAKGSNGGGNGGGGGGGSKPGKEVNNCVPQSSCTASVQGIAGKNK